MLGGTAQTNKLIGQKLAGGFNTQEDCKAGKNGAIVCSRESPRRWGRQDPEHVLCAGQGTIQQQQPSNLKVRDVGRRGAWLASGRAA